MSCYSFLEYTKNFTTPVNQNVSNITSFNKLAILDRVSTLKIENPKITKKELSIYIGLSGKTLSRYSEDLGENICKKKSYKKNLIPSPCDECDFIAKNKAGLQAHHRAKHLYNRQTINKNKTKVDTSERKLDLVSLITM